MARSRLSALSLLACLCIFPVTQAQAAPGEEVYKQVCCACHDTGANGAPRIGDSRMWAPLIKEGQSRLTADGWIGERGMPPRGGKPELSMEDFSRAVAYMARASGAKWDDPDAAMLASIQKRVQARLEARKAKK